MLLLLAIAAWESKSNLTIFPTLLIKKLLFRDISSNFLLIVLITILSLSLTLSFCSANQWTGFYMKAASVMKGLSSKKLDYDFDCDTNLLIPMSSLLIYIKKVLWLATNNNFRYRQELKM